MIVLRPYQEQLLQHTQEALSPPKARVMLQLPTGGGKTRIATALLAEWLRDSRKAAWLTHRRELSDQTCEVLKKSGVAAMNRPEWNADDPAPSMKNEVTILMSQTISRRNHIPDVWNDYGPEDLLVIDEAHHATAPGWTRAIEQWPGPVIGMTATPWRLEKHLGFDHSFNSMISGPQISEMQSSGSLAHAQVLMPSSDEVILGGQNLSNRDYSELEIRLANQDRPDVMTGRAVEFWHDQARDRQTIVYAVSVGHAENLAEVFNERNIPAGVILGDSTSKDRALRIRQFSGGALRILINVAVATEGFDLPDASCVVLARPTKSLALYLQMVGRGLRPKSDGGYCLVLDLAGNVERHGFPDDDRQWSLQPRGRQEPGSGPPVVRCRDCNGVSPTSSHNCRLCDNPFGKTCRLCSRWRTWMDWSAEEYCCNMHDLVCNRCHRDVHFSRNLPTERGLSEMLDEELTERLHELEEVRTQLRHVAKQLTLIYAKTTFNDLTDRMRDLLGREAQTKKAIYVHMERKVGANVLKRMLGHLQVPVEEIAEDEFQMGDGWCRLIRRSKGEIIEWDSSQ